MVLYPAVFIERHVMETLLGQDLELDWLTQFAIARVWVLLR